IQCGDELRSLRPSRRAFAEVFARQPLRVGGDGLSKLQPIPRTAIVSCGSPRGPRPTVSSHGSARFSKRPRDYKGTLLADLTGCKRKRQIGTTLPPIVGRPGAEELTRAAAPARRTISL